jgi:phage-related protein
MEMKLVQWIASSNRDIRVMPESVRGTLVRFSKAIYVLHCFQKKSTSGIATSQQDIELIRSRLMTAEQHAKENDYV